MIREIVVLWKYGPIPREGRSIPSDAPNGPSFNANAENPHHTSKSARKRQLRKKFQLINQNLPSPQHPSNSNPQQLLSSFNPQQLLSSFNPQHLLSSSNPQQLHSSFNPQQLLSCFNSQQFTPSFSGQRISDLDPQSYIQSKPQPLSSKSKLLLFLNIPIL